MIVIAREDENLEALIGRTIPSEMSPDVSYRPEQILGKGGGSIAFLAKRTTREGSVPVVLKILRPAFVRKLGPTAELLIRKEAVALGRLNERVPPTPFVIRLIDTGTVAVEHRHQALALPWVVIEYVHGGSLGTTLAQRVRRSLRDTGHAFDPSRAAHAIDCIAQGLAAVHEVGVFHRDLTPNNVLCSGRGLEEVFKIADFGVARPIGVTGTLSGALVGTPGFAAPELATGGEVGTFTDVFSLASLIFFLLTGEPIYGSTSDVITGERRTLLSMPGLSPELRKDEKACRSIDLVLGWAASPIGADRLNEALAVSSLVLPHLPRSIRAEVSYSTLPRAPEASIVEPERWSWSVLHQPGSQLVLRSVAWDGHGRAIAATAGGLSFWSGTQWRVAATEGLGLRGDVRFVRRVGAGRWILGAEGGELMVYATGGAAERVEGPRGATRVSAFEGDLDDIGVLVTESEGGTPSLHTYATKRWLRALDLVDVAAVTALTRFDDARWIVAGRYREGGAFAALYSALDWELEILPTPPDARALLAAVSRPRKGIAHLVGTHGTVVSRDGEVMRAERVPGEPLLSAVALDPYGRPWAASLGRIYMRDDLRGWTTVWEDPSLTVPFVALFLDAGLCLAMTADGGVVEGRSLRSAHSELPPAPGLPRV